MLLALPLSLLAFASAGPQARKPEPARPPLVLEGVWLGVEVTDVGSRHPTVTFTKDGGTLAYEDATGGTGSFKMRLQAFKVEGAQVHFAVPGGGKLRHYSGRWDGQKITGSFSADASGATPIGTFELRRPVYLEGPSSRSSGASSPAAPAPAAGAASSEPEAEPATAEATPAPSRIDSAREEGKKRLEQRLSRISDQASQLLVRIGEWQASCRGGGTPLYDQPAVDCDGMIREIGRLGLAVGRGLEEAEDEARRSWVEPGTVRELRADHGLDSSKWDELSSKIREAEAEWARRKR